jgi:hypothetical protein
LDIFAVKSSRDASILAASLAGLPAAAEDWFHDEFKGLR